MALKIGTISRKPGLVWRGTVQDRPGSWAPLLRRLMDRYQIGVETEGRIKVKGQLGRSQPVADGHRDDTDEGFVPRLDGWPRNRRWPPATR